MEFHIRLAGAKPDLDAIEQCLHAVDPAGVIDIDEAGHLRVATAMNADALVVLVRQAGLAVNAAQVTQVPSTCCGGCSG